MAIIPGSRFLVFFGFIGCLTNALAATDHALQDCRRITEDPKRLACYDALIDTPSTQTQQTPAPAATFGLEAKKNPDAPTSVQSRLQGNFIGWQGSTRFTLINGQVWQQAEPGDFHYEIESPMVSIEKGLFGGYFLRVEGLNKVLKVKRVQ